MRKIVLILLCLVGFSTALWADETQQVQTLVKDKIGLMISYLKDPNLSKQERNQKIIKMILPIFDFKIMAKVSLGRKYWNQMNKNQRKEFIDLFVQRLKKSYLEKLNLYTDEDVTVEDAVRKKSRIYVKTYLVTKIDKKEMIYKFYHSKGRWRIYDVEILGVSIVQTYRSQFRGLLKSAGIESLLEKLRNSSHLSPGIL